MTEEQLPKIHTYCDICAKGVNENFDKLRAEIERLQERIAELEQERRWISVTPEAMPEEGQFVEIDFGLGEYTVGLWVWENEPAEWSNGIDYISWQHWNIGAERVETSNEPPINWRPLPQKK